MVDATSRTFAASPARGLVWPGGVAPCVFGRSGLINPDHKREGDGATPAGVLALREVFFRPDRLTQPDTRLPVSPISPEMGWCDAPDSPRYNQRVTLPFDASHERMWREDHLYDLVVALGWNDDPVAAGRGSAIFLHVASPDWTPTEGCVAASIDALMALVAAAQPGDALEIVGQP